jgi:hypothetical protein
MQTLINLPLRVSEDNPAIPPEPGWMFIFDN